MDPNELPGHQGSRFLGAGQVVSHDGPMVTVETRTRLVRVNHTKVRRQHDEWHDIPLPPQLSHVAVPTTDKMVLMSQSPYRDMLEIGQPPYVMSDVAARQGQALAV